MRHRNFYMHKKEKPLRGKGLKKPKTDVEMQTNAVGVKVS
jgi:hypothetical protein